MLRKSTALARCLSPPARARGATRQLRPPTPSQRRVSRAAHARRRLLSLGRMRSTKACCALVPCCAGCGRRTPYARALRWPELSLLRRRPMMRRASCGNWRKASAACVSRSAFTLALAVSWKKAHHASLPSARAMLCWLWLDYALRKGTAPARGLSPSARARGVTCQLRYLTPSQRRLSRGACSLALTVSREEAHHTSLLCARAMPR